MWRSNTDASIKLYIEGNIRRKLIHVLISRVSLLHTSVERRVQKEASSRRCLLYYARSNALSVNI